MLCCGVLSGTLFPSFVPFSCACLTLKGFAIGFVMKQFQIEYAWWGVVYGLAGIILPSFCMLTGLIFVLGRGCLNCVDHKNEQRLGARRLAFLGSLRSVDGFSYRDGDSARRSRSAGAFALDNRMILSKN